ncbi:Stf0 family sulfotransferase [Micromonospora sp. NPDC050686]|uniref:Stf0 family sulfotransferase n=1 Tax=Micromonospora sp. NPDC050686 TaxID=3154631 RepID=UPI0033CFADC6
MAHTDFDSYLICATPRTGSTLLCGLLESSGVAGHPASYFNRKTLAHYADAWGLAGTHGDQINAGFVEAALAVGRTSNQIFGGRVMAETLPELVDGLAASTREAVSTDLDLLTRYFGRLKFIHLKRGDIVGQAVSWAKAQQTKFYHPHEGVVGSGAQEPVYDQELITRLVTTIEHAETEWTVWFSDQGLAPLEVTYEELASDPLGTAGRALEYLGLHLPVGQRLVIGHQRQADAVNAEWVEKFVRG